MIQAYDVYPQVLYCGVDEKVFSVINTRTKNQLFFVGSVDTPQDGYDLVKDALSLVPKDKRPELLKLSWKKENGERLEDKDLVKIYNESLAVLCTSRLEGAGLIPLEAMSCGAIVIATNVGGHRETIKDGETGFLVGFKPEEIAARILSLQEDKKLVEKIGKQSRLEIEKNWTWKKQITNLEKSLIECAKMK